MTRFPAIIMAMLSIGLLILGCAPTQPEHISARIVYRDLAPLPMDPSSQTPEKIPEVKIPAPQPRQVDTQKREDAPQTTASKIPSGKEPPAGNSPIFFVAFENESATAFDQDALTAFTAKFKNTAPILVVGHSHGASTVGVRDLATRRAETVKHYLKRNGYLNVHTMAAWDEQPVSFAPKRGVYLYIMPAFKQGKTDNADG